MPNCQNCGKPVDEGAPYCLSCGAAQAPVVGAAAWPSAPVGAAPPPGEVQPPAAAYAPAPAYQTSPPVYAPAPAYQTSPPAYQTPPGGQPAGAASAPASKHGGVPGWVIAIIVAGVVALVAGPFIIIFASMLFVGDVVENVAPVVNEQIGVFRESSVRDGAHSLEIGVQNWAADHGGRYPAARRVTEAELVAADGSGYLETWPSNPFLGGPMQQGTEAGEFTYRRGPGGDSYTIAAYGENGEVLITLP